MRAGRVWRTVLAVMMLMGCMGLASAEETEVYSRTVEIEGLGTFSYYAQNDPKWAKMDYEPRGSDKHRTMKAGGCGPTSLAIAVASQLPSERLPELQQYASNPEKGFPFCDCSVNAHHYYGGHEVMTPTEADDFAEYFPVILASYATGNNDHWIKLRKANYSGTSLSLFRMICEAYGLNYEAYSEWEDARKALESGATIITTVTKGIFTSSSHYMCIAGIADGWVYLLDPLMRSEYPGDKRGWVEVIEPGVIRAREENIGHLWLYGFYAISNDGDAPAN